MIQELRGTRVILREQRPEDAKFFAYWFNRPEIMFQCGFTEPTDEEKERAWILTEHRREDPPPGMETGVTSMERLLHSFTEGSAAILGDNLTGVYLHGSAVMGCFNPAKSDLDLIVVVREPLSEETKRAYMDMVAAHHAAGPAKGIEMSVVLREVCKPFVYPTPFELHFSVGHLAWYTADPEDYIRKMKGVDKDLAAHFTVINKRGRRLYGPPIHAVFGEVPKQAYLDSLWFDVAGAEEEIAEYPLYLTLNLARVLAYAEDGLVLSKREGGDWALNRLPAEYHPLVRNALREYAEAADVVYDPELARRYAGYMLDRIRRQAPPTTV